MFATRIRNAALALAGAAIIASALLTPVAAATSESMPLVETEAVTIPLSNTSTEGTETNAKLPTLELLRADIQVVRIDQGGTGARGERAFATFRVTNLGPHPMKFNLYTDVTKRKPADDSYSPISTNNIVTMQSGETKDVELKCEVDIQHQCYYFIVQADHIQGNDPNMQNNGADFAP